MTPDSIRLRTADVGDAAALARFGERTFRETFGAHHAAADMDAYCRDAFALERVRDELGDPERETFVAESAGEIVGYVQLHAAPAPDCVRGPAPLEVLRFYVERAWHGRGVAQALMARVVTAAEQRGAQTLFLLVWEHNQRAYAFYQKHGFRQVGSMPFVLASDRPIDYVMTRALTATASG
jgi:ribosomal protein S18 acetylase RimI-like enzyme